MAKQPKPETPPQNPATVTTAVLELQSNATGQIAPVIDAGNDVAPAKPRSGNRIATATRLIDHDGAPVAAGDPILLAEAAFKALAAVGAVLETDWDELADA